MATMFQQHYERVKEVLEEFCNKAKGSKAVPQDIKTNLGKIQAFQKDFLHPYEANKNHSLFKLKIDLKRLRDSLEMPVGSEDSIILSDTLTRLMNSMDNNNLFYCEFEKTLVDYQNGRLKDAGNGWQPGAASIEEVLGFFAATPEALSRIDIYRIKQKFEEYIKPLVESTHLYPALNKIVKGLPEPDYIGITSLEKETGKTGHTYRTYRANILKLLIDASGKDAHEDDKAWESEIKAAIVHIEGLDQFRDIEVGKGPNPTINELFPFKQKIVDYLEVNMLAGRYKGIYYNEPPVKGKVLEVLAEVPSKEYEDNTAITPVREPGSVNQEGASVSGVTTGMKKLKLGASEEKKGKEKEVLPEAQEVASASTSGQSNELEAIKAELKRVTEENERLKQQSAQPVESNDVMFVGQAAAAAASVEGVPALTTAYKGGSPSASRASSAVISPAQAAVHEYREAARRSPSPTGSSNG